MAAVDSSETFADWLRDQLAARGWGVRTLARAIDPQNPEVPRRALNRYLRGSLPTAPYVDAIAAALNVSRDDLPLQEGALVGAPFRVRPRAGAAEDGGSGGREGARNQRDDLDDAATILRQIARKRTLTYPLVELERLADEIDVIARLASLRWAGSTDIEAVPE